MLIRYDVLETLWYSQIFHFNKKQNFRIQTSSDQVVRLASHVVSRVGWPKSGMPVLTEQLVTEGSYFEACFGQLRIYIHETKHNCWKVE